MYLNTVNFGSGAYGVEKAAEIYFGMDAADLTLPQAALLAGLLRAPELYSPFNDIEKAESRRNLVLQLMYEQELISTTEYLNALAAPVEINKNQVASTGQAGSRIAPYFVDYVKRNLYDQKFTDRDVFKGGLRIYTTLDTKLQEKAENAIKKVFPEDIGPSYSLVCTDPENGYIYSLIGGKDYNTSKFNIAIQGKRQPGSVFKVPVLIESIRQHISPNNTFNPNGPITIKMSSGPDWVVENYVGEKFDTNKMSIIDATIHSVNIVYAQLTMEVGAENIEKLCEEMEIYDIGSNPAIGLGGLETGITPLDISKIFSTLASGGVYHQPVCILKIEDAEGNILYEYNPDENKSNKRILEDAEAYHITDILKKVIERGTGTGAAIGRPAAGKTGTTSDYKDAWFAGYTPDLVAVVWMGYADSNKPMEPINGRTLVGGSYPADIWREFMSSALEDTPVSDFKKPDRNLIDIEICTASNLLATLWCPEETKEWKIFVEGEEPEDICNIHNKVEVPDVTGFNIDEAKALFEDLHFVVEEIHDYNDEFPEGAVFKQNPEAGTILESLEGEMLSITLYVSKGVKTFEMPDLKGIELNKATKILDGLELVIDSVIYEFSDTVTEDKIIEHSPPPGSIVSKSTKVTLYISKGENPESIIPDVTGLSEDEAISMLEDAGFKRITVISEESIEEIDKVFAQTPVGGTTYDKKLEIIIKISKGVEVPDVINLTKSDAVTLLEEEGFIFEFSTDSLDDGIVLNQTPAGGSYLNYGSTVTLKIQ
jgi:membrane peptidoglycan carboxypeptidase